MVMHNQLSGTAESSWTPPTPDSLMPRILESKFNGYRVELVNPADERVAEAHEMEVFNMVELGDPELEVRDEMSHYHEESSFILATSQDGQLEGMVRIVPHTPQKGIKTANDLAEILTFNWQRSLPQPPNDEVRQEMYISKLIEVSRHIKDDTGQTDFSKLWDVPTLATNLNASTFKRAAIALCLTASLAQVTVEGYNRGEVTHVVSFNEVSADDFFRKAGYPVTPLNGYEPMLYDSYGTEVGITAQPGWFSVAELKRLIDGINHGTLSLGRTQTRHLARVALINR